MAHNTTKHPANSLLQTSQHLEQQTLFAHRQAANGAASTRRISAELATLDLEQVFRQLHEMVALISGRPRSYSNKAKSLTADIKAQAAE